ncbi:response regulator [bacterium]|nr:response regulator [candidate division CSSED10-310 bacterium]
MTRYARVPPRMAKLFQTAEEYVSRYFSEKHESPGEGTIEIHGERYILIRAASMSVELFKTLSRLYQKEDESCSIAKNLLFDLAHAIGKSDAAFFHRQNKLVDPIAKLSAGPIHFAFTGWASVSIMPESNPVPDESYFLIYDHPFSFESDGWIRSGLKSEFPVCFMNAGYSAGWCEESFGVRLVAAEVLCRASGDECCRFIMAPPERIQEHIERYSQQIKMDPKRLVEYMIPGLFKRKEMEHLLWQSELRYKMLFEDANDAIYILQDDCIIQANSCGKSALGRTHEEVIGRTILDFSPRIQSSNLKSGELWRCKHELAFSGHPSIFEWQFQKVDGTLIDMEISLKLIDDGQRLSQAICRDITQRKTLESQLIQSQKMQAIGTLASGIAHDFNNILSGMLGFTSLLKIQLPRTDLNFRYLERIEGAVNQAADLTRQLLSFSRKSEFRTVPMNVNDHILNVLKLLERTSGFQIESRVELDPDVKGIEGDPSQFEQMIMNLCLNSARAMPDGGVLKIVTRMAGEAELESVQFAEFTGSKAVCIEVVDTGIGMSREVLERVFEPYFSVRSNGSGTGLGMLIVYNILKSHHGHIMIQSQPGEGTCVRLYLPPTFKPILKHTVIMQEMRTGSETILVVDDEVMITEFLEELLKPLGYSVVTAHDGSEAIKRFKSLASQIDLAVINIGISKAGGEKMAQVMLEIRPELEIVLTSGLPFSAELKKQYGEMGIKGFVQKPFKPEEICKLIREILDRRSSG